MEKERRVEDRKEGNKKKIIVLIVVGIIALVLGLALVFVAVLRNNDDKELQFETVAKALPCLSPADRVTRIRNIAARGTLAARTP